MADESPRLLIFPKQDGLFRAEDAERLKAMLDDPTARTIIIDGSVNIYQLIDGRWEVLPEAPAMISTDGMPLDMTQLRRVGEAKVSRELGT